MTSDSIVALRRIRHRMQQSLSSPDFQVRFAYGLQTGFDEADLRRWGMRFDPAASFNHLWTLESIAQHFGLKNHVYWHHRFIRDFMWVKDSSAWPRERGACRSWIIEPIFASDGQNAALRLYLDDLNALQGWVVANLHHITPRQDPSLTIPWISWHGFVCLMKLAYPARFTFGLMLEPEGGERGAPSIARLDTVERFWNVARLASNEPPAVHMILPSMDARICSIEVIEAVLDWGVDNTEPRPLAAEDTDADASGSQNALDRTLTECEQWCIETIKQQGRRLPKSELQGLATKADKVHGKSTIANCLPRLCKDGFLRNQRTGGPYGNGYGLPEWE